MFDRDAPNAVCDGLEGVLDLGDHAFADDAFGFERGVRSGGDLADEGRLVVGVAQHAALLETEDQLRGGYLRRAPQPIDYGFVGDIEKVDSRLLGRLLEAGVTPVFCAIMHDGQGTLLNCNADSVASSVALGAARIAPTELVFCFEKSGVLRDPEDETTLIREITAESYAALKAGGIVSKGMIPKVENALKAVANGVRSVTIKHSENLLNDTGTVIR